MAVPVVRWTQEHELERPQLRLPGCVFMEARGKEHELERPKLRLPGYVFIEARGRTGPGLTNVPVTRT